MRRRCASAAWSSRRRTRRASAGGQGESVRHPAYVHPARAFPPRRSCPMWIVRFTDAQRDALKLLIEAQGEVGPSLGGAAEALDLARWDELPDAELPWDVVAALASLQGIGEADVVWDLAAGGRLPATHTRARPN